jgi:hypothetical protein
MTTGDILGFIWSNNSVPGRLFATLILLLGIAAAGAALWHRRRYRVTETQALEMVQGRLRRALEAQQPDPSADDVEATSATDAEGEPAAGIRTRQQEPVDLRELSEKVPAETLIGDRLAAVARMKQARVKVTVEALQQMTVLRESAVTTLAFPGYAVDLAMMLGLLGTFFGLCLMLLQMQGVVPGAGGTGDAGNFAAAASSLGDIIASKKTAFATTLVGLVCAVTISWLNFLLARAQSAFYDRLERFTAAELLPATVPGVENESAMEKLSLQLTDAFTRLGTLTEQHTEQVERVEAMQASFATIVESIRGIMVHAAHAPPEETTGVMAGLAKQLADTNQALVRLAGAVNDGMRRVPYERVDRGDRGPSVIGPNTVGLLRGVEGALGVFRRYGLLALAGAAVVFLVFKIW